MAKSNRVIFHSQTPADVHALLQLLAKLGMVCGPMKAAEIRDDGQVNVWFVAAKGAADVKRVSARLVQSWVSETFARRVYLNVRVQDFRGEWRNLTDADYIAANLEPSWKYDVERYIAITFDTGRCEGEWCDTGAEAWNASETVTYHRFLEGDHARAIAEAKRRIEAFERGE